MSHPNRQIVRRSTLAEQGKEDDLRNTTAEDRLKMMWRLAVDAWAMKGGQIESRLPRHVVRVIRGGR
jgi:hypothetical protein